MNEELKDCHFMEDGFYINELQEEIERLQKGYCELKEKCNKGECDCTHEEYNGMCEANMKLDLEVDKLNKIIEIKTSRIQDLMKRLSKRTEKVERLNNIINELEKWVKEDEECFETQFYMGRCVNFQCILDKLQELKGSGKE